MNTDCLKATITITHNHGHGATATGAQQELDKLLSNNTDLLAALEGLLAAKDKARTREVHVGSGDIDVYYNGFDMAEAEDTAIAAIAKARPA